MGRGTRRYALGKSGDPRDGIPPMKSAQVNALGKRLSDLLSRYRWVEARNDKVRDEEFERDLRQMRDTLATYREILIAHGLMQPGAEFRRQ